MKDRINELFNNIPGMENYQRVDPVHQVPWYVGLDANGRYSVFVITKTEPKEIVSTKLLSVYIGNRKDGTYGITFSLNEKTAYDLFLHFCEDMIDSSRKLFNADYVADYVCSRYILWQKAFSRTNGSLLSFEQIKGLIGELYFLKMKMIPMYGEETAVDSWSGIEQTDQDFTCDTTWYEVKSAVSGASSVKISSVEQLDVRRPGHLAVVILDKTSEADSSRITLNSMVELVTTSIGSKVLQEKLKNRLLAYGYYFDKAYDSIGFRCNGLSLYKVDDVFPCLRKENIPFSVQNAKYELSLSAIDSYKEG